VPILRAPALLCAFSGWADAGFAASQALRYLLQKRESRQVAEFDSDLIFNYTMTRPSAAFASPGQRVLRYPSLAWYSIQVPEAEHDLLILVGPEPDLRWRECLERATDFMLQAEVREVITLGAFLGQVHYATAPMIMGLAGTDELRERLRQLSIQETDYEGPTGFASGVAAATSAKGIPAVSLWAAVPNYLPNLANPKLSAALLGVAEQLLGQELWREELEVAGRDMERRIDEAMRARPDLSQFLRQLAGQQTPEPPTLQLQASGEDSDEQMELPSAEEVLKDLEEHLRRLRGQGPGDVPPAS